MISYIDQWNLWNDADLRTRTNVACMNIAYRILLEAPDTKDNTARLTWAKAVFANPDQSSKDVMWPVVLNETVQQKGKEALSDEELQAIVDQAVEGMMKRYG